MAWNAAVEAKHKADCILTGTDNSHVKCEINVPVHVYVLEYGIAIACYLLQ